MLGVDLPSIFQMEITDFCPFGCKYCPWGIGLVTREIRIIKIEDIVSWIRRGDFDSTHVLQGLHVMGEPTSHPKYIQIVNLLNDHCIKVIDATSCYRFYDRKFVDELLKLREYSIILSLDGHNYTEFKKVKDPDNNLRDDLFKNIFDGIIYFLKNVTYKTLVRVLPVGNWKETYNFWKQFENSNVKVSVKFMATWGDALKVSVDRPSLKEAEGICPYPFRNVTVLVDGSVVPCPYMYNGEYSYGNLFRQSLKEIWNSKSRVELIKDYISGKYTVLPCRNCREWMFPQDVTFLRDFVIKT